MRRSQEDEFTEFAAASMGWMTRTATFLTGDRHRADDVVQQALVSAYVKWGKVRSAADPSAYVRQMMVNAAIDEKRSPRRREVLTDEHRETGRHRGNSSGHDTVVDREPLLAALRTLSPQQRAVVALRFLLDHDVATTASLLGISEGTVKSTSHDGLKALRSRLPAAQH